MSGVLSKARLTEARPAVLSMLVYRLSTSKVNKIQFAGEVIDVILSKKSVVFLT